MKYKLPIIGAVIASSMLLAGCDQRKVEVEIDYKALAAAIGEELSKRSAASTSTTTAGTNDLSSKPVTKSEIDYVIDDRGYNVSRGFGESFNFPVCFIVYRRGGGLSAPYNFDSLPALLSGQVAQNCQSALARWATEKNVQVPQKYLR